MLHKSIQLPKPAVTRSRKRDLVLWRDSRKNIFLRHNLGYNLGYGERVSSDAVALETNTSGSEFTFAFSVLQTKFADKKSRDKIW